jgi:hypothetical protein
MPEPIITCPTCNEYIVIEKLNCGIFRHGILKETGKQMDPHLCKEKCDELIEKGLIYGCGHPFQILNENGVWKIQSCAYI